MDVLPKWRVFVMQTYFVLVFIRLLIFSIIADLSVFVFKHIAMVIPPIQLDFSLLYSLTPFNTSLFSAVIAQPDIKQAAVDLKSLYCGKCD